MVYQDTSALYLPPNASWIQTLLVNFLPLHPVQVVMHRIAPYSQRTHQYVKYSPACDLYKRHYLCYSQCPRLAQHLFSNPGV